MKTKIEIKSIYGSVLFSYESEDNTTKKAVEEAIKQRANLSEADLSEANLSRAYLSGANLSRAYLSGADLSGANLSEADLSEANLSRANLSRADLSEADLSEANLSRADLSGADLSRANLSGANLSEANLSGANLSGVYYKEGTGFLLPQCPSEGSFVAWKKASDYIVKLLVCEDAKRSSATTLKCRCSKATILSIENCDGTKAEVNSVKSNHDNSFVYTIGETIEVKDFDEDRFNECSSGIHFFIARESAVKY